MSQYSPTESPSDSFAEREPIPLPFMHELLVLHRQPRSRTFVDLCLELLALFREARPGVEIETLRLPGRQDRQIPLAFEYLIRQELVDVRTAYDVGRRAYRGKLVQTTERGRLTLAALGWLDTGQRASPMPLEAMLSEWLIAPNG